MHQTANEIRSVSVSTNSNITVNFLIRYFTYVTSGQVGFLAKFGKEAATLPLVTLCSGNLAASEGDESRGVTFALGWVQHEFFASFSEIVDGVWINLHRANFIIATDATIPIFYRNNDSILCVQVHYWDIQDKGVVVLLRENGVQPGDTSTS